MTPGQRAVLRSEAPDLGIGSWNEHFSGGDDCFDLLELRAAPELVDSPNVTAPRSGTSAKDTVYIPVDTALTTVDPHTSRGG